MKERKTVTLIGGDRRQAAVAERLFEAGYTVRTFGLPRELLRGEISCCEDWQKAVEGAATVVLPLPASPDGKHVHLPLYEGEGAPTLPLLLSALPAGTALFGGKCPPTLREAARAAGLPLTDYFESEELQQKNALPTAEGALFILMREMPLVVAGLRVAVTGFGRIARALSHLLLAMGAEVTVAARKESDLRLAEAQGCRTVPLDGKSGVLALTQGHDAIFNTVPAVLFDAEVLAALSHKTLLIDLASAPGGFDANAAAKAGHRVIWALSLPGKYAPVTAGRLIAETILSALEAEENV